MHESGARTIPEDVHRSPTRAVARMVRNSRVRHNNKVHTGTKVSPFQANSGQNPRMGFEMRKKGRFEKAEKFVERMKEV